MMTMVYAEERGQGHSTEADPAISTGSLANSPLPCFRSTQSSLAVLRARQPFRPTALMQSREPNC